MASPAEVFEALRAAHAKADADGAARLYAPDAVYYGPDNLVHKGPEEIRNHLASYFANRGPVEVTVKRHRSHIVEREYLQHGGILQYVLRRLLAT